MRSKGSADLGFRRPQPRQRRTPGPASRRSVREPLDVRALGKDPAHDGALHALALAVDQPDLPESALACRFEVPLDRGWNVAGSEDVQIQGILDRYDDDFLVLPHATTLIPQHGSRQGMSFRACRIAQK